jgi:hypothetical protein
VFDADRHESIAIFPQFGCGRNALGGGEMLQMLMSDVRPDAHNARESYVGFATLERTGAGYLCAGTGGGGGALLLDLSEGERRPARHDVNSAPKRKICEV